MNAIPTVPVIVADARRLVQQHERNRMLAHLIQMDTTAHNDTRFLDDLIFIGNKAFTIAPWALTD